MTFSLCDFWFLSAVRLPHSSLLWPRKGQTLDEYIRECDSKTRTDVEKVSPSHRQTLLQSHLLSRRMLTSTSAKRSSLPLNKSNLLSSAISISARRGRHPSPKCYLPVKRSIPRRPIVVHRRRCRTTRRAIHGSCRAMRLGWAWITLKTRSMLTCSNRPVNRVSAAGHARLQENKESLAAEPPNNFDWSVRSSFVNSR